ncbi:MULTISPECIES: hypothetical protein [Microbacterium]|uniref:Urease accessory protein n=1 Tax=Microbacterium marmarense TaxID=3122051 RepID=A0ABU8LTR7_9MICO
MPQRLIFNEADAAADAMTFAGRSSPLGDGAVRLRASDGVLVMTSAPLAPRGLFDATPTILAMRVLAVDPELVCDLTVSASTLQLAQDDATSIELPETAVSEPWAGVTPPRAGWVTADDIPAATLAARAQWGITTVAESLPANPGEDVVRSVRAAVWGAADDELNGLPLGAAFAAFALGFIAGEEQARVRTAASWTRITLDRGHVLIRRPERMGLTEVRSTGRA